MAASSDDFFDASNNIEDNFSDESDCSFHSLNEDLNKITIEDVLQFSKEKDSSKSTELSSSPNGSNGSNTSFVKEQEELF
mgnify:CR=1 FL=1